ncbi:MAG: acyl-CoA desaturase [Betaproteobacteria bacterium]|jgi:stearoyl-CoA desaturase (delta-9 desaturase)|nr:fatty acid desaturase [Burkholderiales bacterium]MCE2645933.1 fatty acid desaturase [Burkholderiaceae bacterium]
MYLFQFLDGGLLDLSFWQLVVAALLLTHVTIAGVTIYLHRSQAHRALDLHPAIGHFFRAWLWLTTGMQTREWVSIHRKHHAKCETAEDPHSPQTRGLKKVLWEGAELYMAESQNAETLAKYSHGTPNDWAERNVYSRFTWHGCGVMLGLDLILFGAAGLAIWGVQMMWIPFLAAGVINGIGHFWGYRNFDAPDASTNIVPWGILIGGEELHNNHHTFPTSAKLSSKWYEFDIGWLYIRLMQSVGLARVLRLAPVPKVAAPKPLVDLDTLQAVVANRYDLLARYARELRRAHKAELDRLPAEQRQRFSPLRRWLRKGDVNALPREARERLAELLSQSLGMKTLVEMRAELAQTWSRSSGSREQMLAHLQDWIARAEASGNQTLQALALRIRSYAPTQVAA